MKWLIPGIILFLLANIGFTLYYYVLRDEADRILVIESYHAENEWDKSYIKGLEEKLKDTHEMIYFQMDTKRIPESQYESRANLAYRRFEELNPALVVLGDDNALKYLGPKLSKSSVPVVYLGINRNPEDYLGPNSSNFTGVLERPLLNRSVYSLTRILGSHLKKVLILFDSGTTSKASVEHVFKGNTQIRMHDISVDLKLIGKWDDWRHSVIESKNDGYDAIIVGLYHTIFDADGNYVNADEVLSWTNQNSPIPQFGFWDFSVGADKTIGGLVLYGEQQGLAAGEIALRILSFNKKPEEIAPKIAERGRYLFSKSQLNKHRITLPSDIQFEAQFIE